MELSGLTPQFDSFEKIIKLPDCTSQIIIKNENSLTMHDAEMHLLDLSFVYYCGHCSKPNLSSAIPLFRL